MCLGTSSLAQDIIVVDFLSEPRFTGLEETIVKGDNVTFKFIGDNSMNGAYLSGGRWVSVYNMKISAPRSIAVIEYQTITTKSTKNDIPSVSTGNISKSGDTWVWKPNSSSVTLMGNADDANASFCVTRMRLWFNESEYKEGTAWETSGSEGGDDAHPYTYNVDFSNDDTDYDKMDRLYSSVNVLPVDGKGVPMAVVSDRKFQSILQPYLKWKTQQGYQVTELYTDTISGKRGTELAFALREKLMAMNPRPSYVLLVGDVAQVPAFTGITGSMLHNTDYYYGEYTGDRYADAYVGRFSATNEEELRPQLDKTMYMATLLPSEGAWLKQSITVNDVTDDIKAMDESVTLSLNYPKNFEGNMTEEEHSYWQTAINSKINNGCSLVSYFGHGNAQSWNNSYTSYYVNQLENKNRYPLVLSITCLTGTYDLNCMAEAFMRKKDAGAVAVLAASKESYANSNNYLFLGGNVKSAKKAMSIGLLRSLFPYVGSDPSQRARTLGQAFDIALYGIARSVTQSFTEVAEFYNIFGDPTYQPYITTPKANKILSSTYNLTAGRSISVTTAPEAVVCLSQDRTIIATGVADKSGRAILRVPSNSPTGVCVLYSSAPGYNDVSRQVTLSSGDGTQDWKDEDNHPYVTHTDVISRSSLGDAVTTAWPISAQTVPALQSSARYAIWATTEQSRKDYSPILPWQQTDDLTECIYMIHQTSYAHCGIATTQSGGKARTVAVEWSHPNGNAEVIGVYGSNTAYTGTDQGYESTKGEKLGELVKGSCNSLILPDGYKYILLRPEPRLQYPGTDNVEIFIKSLSIGWEQELTKCAKPEIAFSDGTISFRCSTSGATYKYGIAPSGSNYVLTAVAEAPGYAPSDEATLTITASQLAGGSTGDINQDGKLSVTDLVKLIDSFKTK